MFLGEIDTYRGIDTYCVATHVYSYCKANVMCMTLHVCIACASKNVLVSACMYASEYYMYKYKCMYGCMYVCMYVGV